MHKFNSGVSFVFEGGREAQYVEPIKAEIAALERWTKVIEELARLSEEPVLINALPRSAFLDRLGLRRNRSAGVTTPYHVDVHGRSELCAQWDALLTRLAQVAVIAGEDL